MQWLVKRLLVWLISKRRPDLQRGAWIRDDGADSSREALVSTTRTPTLFSREEQRANQKPHPTHA